MKRYLSLILAAAMVLSLVPNIAFAADSAETITYNIGTDSVSRAAFTATHLIPMNEAGKLSFTAGANKTLMVSENMFFNVIKFLNSSWINDSNHSSFANSEIGLVSYRPSTYYMYKNYKSGIFTYIPVKKPATAITPIAGASSSGFYSTDGVTAAEFTMPASLDSSKTAPFEVVGRSNGAGHAFFNPTFFYGSWYIGTKADPDANVTDSNFGKNAREQNFIVRIKIPETAKAGKYQVRVSNSATDGESTDKGTTTPSLYNNKHSADSEVYFTKIDPKTGIEAKYADASGIVYSIINSNGAELPRDAYAGKENKLSGLYSSVAYTEKTFDEVFDIAPGEEYLVYFRLSLENIDAEELATGTSEKTKEYSNRYYQNFKLSKIELVPVPEDAEYVKAFDAKEEKYTTAGTATVNAYEYMTDGEKTTVIGTKTVNLGEMYSASAEDREGYHFLYWAKGASRDKIIISYNKDLSFKPQEGANHIIAVYESKENEKNIAEFYNANGQKIETLTEDGVAPALPSLAGFGDAEGWVLWGDKGETLYSAGASVALDGTMIFVAKYPEEPIKVTVNGKKVAYGTEITLKATPGEGEVFKGWIRGNEIVSVSSTYSFRAWESCDVKPMYSSAKPEFSGTFMKISISEFSAGDAAKALMTEFIGLSDAIEKGVIYNGTKIPMKSNASQFTLEAEGGTYTGYAIIKNADGTYSQITDGNYTK